MSILSVYMSYLPHGSAIASVAVNIRRNFDLIIKDCTCTAYKPEAYTGGTAEWTDADDRHTLRSDEDPRSDAIGLYDRSRGAPANCSQFAESVLFLVLQLQALHPGARYRELVAQRLKMGRWYWLTREQFPAACYWARVWALLKQVLGGGVLLFLLIASLVSGFITDASALHFFHDWEITIGKKQSRIPQAIGSMMHDAQLRPNCTESSKEGKILRRRAS